MTRNASCIQELSNVETAGAVFQLVHKRLCLGTQVEQQGVEAGESTLTMATMFLTAFRVQVSGGAKREEAFNSMHTTSTKKSSTRKLLEDNFTFHATTLIALQVDRSG